MSAAVTSQTIRAMAPSSIAEAVAALRDSTLAALLPGAAGADEGQGPWMMVYPLPIAAHSAKGESAYLPTHTPKSREADGGPLQRRAGHAKPLAKALMHFITQRLARECLRWAGCMWRRTVGIQPYNPEQAAQMHGYGPWFSYESATQEGLDQAALGAFPLVSPDGGSVDAGLTAAHAAAFSALAANQRAVAAFAHTS